MNAAGALRFAGIAAGPGYAVGHVHLLDREAQKIPIRKLSPAQVDREIERFDRAVAQSIEQLDSLLRRMKETAAEGTLILEAHRLILKDEMLIERTRELIRQECLNAEAALEKRVSTLEAAFSNLEKSYFQERGSDLRFAGSRILVNLMGNSTRRTSTIPSGAVVVAHDLSPAQTLELTARRINGFVTEVGGKASHTTILARAMEIPAVVGATGILEHAANGQWIALDGNAGAAILNPESDTIQRFRARRREYRARQNELLANRDAPSETLDGIRVVLEGNIEYLAEIESLLSHGGEGIGLFRTEYVFLRGLHPPDEEGQYDEYRRIVEEIAPFPATLRTLDVGADKLVETAPLDPDCENPALGLRGVRLTLRNRELLKSQLRALLRASAHGRLRLLVPFVASVEDVREVKALIEECKDELRRDGLRFEEQIPFGVMIEVPSAALIAEMLATEVDFFSIGTNDLVQYTLAVDRDNQSVASLYRPLHPAVLRLIKRTARAAREANIGLSICGEMAGEPFNVPILLGCGLDNLSMNPISIPAVKDIIRRCDVSACRALVEEVLTYATVERIEARVRQFHAETTQLRSEVRGRKSEVGVGREGIS